MKFLLAFSFLLLAFSADVAAAEAPATPSEQEQRLIQLRDSLKPIHGVVGLPQAKASLNLGDKYYFLSAADARRVLTEGWGNPPSASDDVLGMIFPVGKTFLDETWGAVVRYDGTAYVSDKDAETADYGELMTNLKAGADEANAERQKAGYEPLHVIGWAQPPTYNRTRNDLIWAQELQFGAETDHTLNYDVRHLGRHGVLSMNMISTMSHLAEVRDAAVVVGAAAEFDAGQRYADHAKGDKEAGYGLAGLVAAGVGVGVAKKAGLLGILALVLKKGAVLIAGAVAAAGAWFRKLFQKKDL